MTGEFEGARLGDAQRSARLLRIAASIERDASAGFPQALESAAELEAFYRFLNNDSFDADAVFKPHKEATFERATNAGTVVVIHDTTTIEFPGEGTRRGLGYTTALGRQGFMAHTSMCVCASTKMPLGIPHLETYSRTGRTWEARKSGRTRAKDTSGPRESARWIRGVDAVAARKATAFDAIHVMDAEADFFELLDHLQQGAMRFVVRAGQLDRRVESDGELTHLRDAVTEIRPRIRRDIALSDRVHPKKKRGSNGMKRHPPRSARRARVAIGATALTLPRTRYAGKRGDGAVSLHVVRIWEEKPPPGEPAIEWVLLTSEPIVTTSDLERVVDTYRMRWMIEEFFKALKTGCSLERRQMESYDALRKVLAILTPIAFRLLYLRGLERTNPTKSASAAFSRLELTLLHKAPAARGYAAPKTASDALALLARLGGHIKGNGAPGWLTLGRGYEKLLLLRLGWTLAIESREQVIYLEPKAVLGLRPARGRGRGAAWNRGLAS